MTGLALLVAQPGDLRLVRKLFLLEPLAVTPRLRHGLAVELLRATQRVAQPRLLRLVRPSLALGALERRRLVHLEA